MNLNRATHRQGDRASTKQTQGTGKSRKSEADPKARRVLVKKGRREPLNASRRTRDPQTEDQGGASTERRQREEKN